MKFAVLVAAAATAGTLAVIAVPTTMITAASDRLGRTRLGELNPFRAIFDSEQQQIQAGITPEQLGLHTSTVTVTPMMAAPPASLKLDLGRAYQEQAQSQIGQNERRMQDLRAYANNPSQWSGPPPN